MRTKTVDDQDNTSLAELDPDKLDDSDQLYHMADAMRDEDDLFELPVIDWERKNDAVLVEIVTPNGDSATVHQSWPDKPTTDNEFIRTCMCAMDVDDPKSAALMADELQDVNHDEFTVPADRDGVHGWELEPNADMPEPLSKRVGQSLRSLFGPGRKGTLVGSLIFGPLGIATTTFILLSESLERHNGHNPPWSDQTYVVARNIMFSLISTMLWVVVLLLLA